MRASLAATIIVASSASALVQPAFSQSNDAATPPREIVVTATRVPTLLDSVPASVTVIDRATIEQRGYATLADALADVPGVRLVQSGGPGGNASLFVRGTNSNQVLVLRDGMRIDDASIANDAFNFGVDTLDDVERIEIVRGPASGLYGSGAIGGVVNIITRKGEGPAHGSVTLGTRIGGPRAALGAADISGATGMFDYSLAVGSTYDQGFDATPKRESSVYTGQHDGFNGQTILLNLGLTPIEGTRISLQLRGRTSAFAYPDVAYPAFDDPDEVGHDTSVSGRLGVESSLLDGAWQTSLFVNQLNDYRHYANLLDANDPNQASENSHYDSRRTELQWNNTVSLPDWERIETPTLSFGFDHISDWASVDLNSQSGGSPYAQNLRAGMTTDAGYLGLQTVVLRWLTLTANAREEATSGVGDDLTWRAGGVLQIPNTPARLKLSYGTGFRAPSLFDRYGIDDFGYVGNPNLKPERSSGWEAGGSIDLHGFGRADFAHVEITFFHNDVSDLINTQFSPVYTEVNIGSARMQGVETMLTLKPFNWLSTELGYTYTDARNLQTGALLLRRPRNAASLTARIMPIPSLTIAPALEYTGAFADSLVDDNGFPAGVGLAKPGLLADLTVNWQATQHISLFLRARNLGNAQFEPASGYVVPGRSVMAGTRAAF